MKAIIYTTPHGVEVRTAAEGRRLAYSVTLADGTVLGTGRDERTAGAAASAIPVDEFLRQWPVEGAVADWAETEDEQIARVAAEDVPVQLTDTDAEIRRKLGRQLRPTAPTPKALKRRAALQYGIGFTETQVQIVEHADVPTDRTLRAAWVEVPGGVGHDMEKARAIAMKAGADPKHVAEAQNPETIKAAMQAVPVD